MATVTIRDIKKRIDEYDLAQAHVSYFSGVNTAQLSRALNGLATLSVEELEALDAASSAMASMIHMMYDIPIDFSKVKKLEPIVKRYMAEHREYVAANSK